MRDGDLQFTQSILNDDEGMHSEKCEYGRRAHGKLEHIETPKI